MTETQPPAREQRHRIANTLQFLTALARLRGQRIGDEAGRRELAWMAGSIGSIGGLEAQRDGHSVDFAAYLREMAQIWSDRIGSPGAKVVVEAEPLRVSDHIAPTLCLIAQELVSNALVHGMADGRSGQVTVRLTVAPDGQRVLLVEDDGDGFDPEAPGWKEGFGLWIARRLAVQVRGTFSLAPRPGVSATLAFPPEP